MPFSICCVFSPQDNNWVTVGQYDSTKGDITLRKDPVFPGGTTIPDVGADRTTYKIAAFFPKHESLGPLASLGAEWESAFRMAVELVNKNPAFKVAFNYVSVDGGANDESCKEAAQVSLQFSLPRLHVSL